jgi:hypothetical protein
MAVTTYGANNISFSSFDSWSNQFSSDSNISLDTLMNNLEPADTPPHQVSELRNNAFLSGTVTGETGGSFQITAGYSTSAGLTSHTLENVNFNSVASVTITATATYPYTFHSFRTAASGGGSALSTTGQGTTTGTYTFDSTEAANFTTIYVYFSTTHSDPSS